MFASQLGGGYPWMHFTLHHHWPGSVHGAFQVGSCSCACVITILSSLEKTLFINLSTLITFTGYWKSSEWKVVKLAHFPSSLWSHTQGLLPRLSLAKQWRNLRAGRRAGPRAHWPSLSRLQIYWSVGGCLFFCPFDWILKSLALWNPIKYRKISANCSAKKTNDIIFTDLRPPKKCLQVYIERVRICSGSACVMVRRMCVCVSVHVLLGFLWCPMAFEVTCLRLHCSECTRCWSSQGPVLRLEPVHYGDHHYW